MPSFSADSLADLQPHKVITQLSGRFIPCFAADFDDGDVIYEVLEGCITILIVVDGEMQTLHFRSNLKNPPMITTWNHDPAHQELEANYYTFAFGAMFCGMTGKNVCVDDDGEAYIFVAASVFSLFQQQQEWLNDYKD